MSAASLGLNILQDMSDPVFEMKFESLPPTSKVSYRLVLVILLSHSPFYNCSERQLKLITHLYRQIQLSTVSSSLLVFVLFLYHITRFYNSLYLFYS